MNERGELREKKIDKGKIGTIRKIGFKKRKYGSGSGKVNVKQARLA